MPTESQLQNTALRLRVCQLIEDGRLPVMMPAQIAAGYGSGFYPKKCRPKATTIVGHRLGQSSGALEPNYWSALTLRARNSLPHTAGALRLPCSWFVAISPAGTEGTCNSPLSSCNSL